MKEKNYWEDFEIGEKIVSPGRTITEADLVMFSAFTGDWHPIHTDVDYASKTIFGERNAHGMLVLAVGGALSYGLGQYVMLPKYLIALYMIDKVRFTGAVKIGDTIYLEVEIVEKTSKDDERGIITSRGTIKNQRGEDCCVFTTKFLCARAPK
jgi:acyl dehydratase